MSIEAGRELDCIIHKQLGLSFRRGVVAIWDKDCKRIYPEEYYYDDENGHGRLIPAYSTDANAALALPLNSEAWFELLGPGWNNPEWGCCVKEHNVPEHYPAPLVIHRGAFQTAKTPALAVCRAWLVWKKRALDR